jgi:hypothetical protein
MRQLFQFLPRGLVQVFFPRELGHARLIHFLLTRMSVVWLDSCFGSFLCTLARCHECKGNTGQFGTGSVVLALLFIPSSLEQS